MSQRERLEATVHGGVQGVGFRWFIRRHAAQLDVVGWVANEPDGSVRVVAEGQGQDLAELARLLAVGPAGAHVDRVETVRLPATGSFAAFEIRARSHRGD